MERKTKTTRIVAQFLTASAVLFAAGGAFAQTAGTPPAAGGMPGPKAGYQMGPGGHGHGHGMWMMREFDTDHDGTISKAEVDAWFNSVDTNHDGKLDKSELEAHRKAMMEKFRSEMEAAFDAKFKAADKNGDGALTRDEFKAGFPRLASRFDQLDANHDGKVTQDEMRAGMQKMHQQRMQQRGKQAPVPSDKGA